MQVNLDLTVLVRNSRSAFLKSLFKERERDDAPLLPVTPPAAASHSTPSFPLHLPAFLSSSSASSSAAAIPSRSDKASKKNHSVSGKFKVCGDALLCLSAAGNHVFPNVGSTILLGGNLRLAR